MVITKINQKFNWIDIFLQVLWIVDMYKKIVNKKTKIRTNTCKKHCYLKIKTQRLELIHVNFNVM